MGKGGATARVFGGSGCRTRKPQDAKCYGQTQTVPPLLFLPFPFPALASGPSPCPSLSQTRMRKLEGMRLDVDARRRRAHRRYMRAVARVERGGVMGGVMGGAGLGAAGMRRSESYEGVAVSRGRVTTSGRGGAPPPCSRRVFIVGCSGRRLLSL